MMKQSYFNRCII